MKILMMILLILLVSAVVLAVLYLLAVMPRMTNRADIRPFLGRLYATGDFTTMLPTPRKIRWRLSKSGGKGIRHRAGRAAYKGSGAGWSFTILL